METGAFAHLPFSIIFSKVFKPYLFFHVVQKWKILSWSKNSLWSKGLRQVVLRLFILKRWFCCCWFIFYCCSHCVCCFFFVLDPCFVRQYFVSFLVLQSSLWGRELVTLLSLSSWFLVIDVWLFLAVPWVCLQFVIVVFPDHTHSLFLVALLLLSSWCHVAVNVLPLPHGALGGFAVCDCGISWSNSRTCLFQ